jgi:hypothetical protein
MEKINDPKMDRLKEAVLLWTGRRDEKVMYPRRQASFLVARFGNEEAVKLLLTVHALEDEFYETDARFTAVSLTEMYRISQEQFNKKHPELPPEIAEAFAWCYTFDFK